MASCLLRSSNENESLNALDGPITDGELCCAFDKLESSVDADPLSFATASEIKEENEDDAAVAVAAAIEEKCAFCRSKQGQLKVLWCLHVACKACLTEFIREDNAISCTRCQFVTQDPSPGRKLVDCLADWPTPPEAGACTTSTTPTPKSSVSVCQDEDCEDSAEPASAECLTCEILLCEAHFAIHTRSRRSRDHDIRQLSGISAAHAQRCQLHSPEVLEQYCHDCCVLLCKVCLRRSADVHKTHQCVDIDVAADQLKDSYSEGFFSAGLCVSVLDGQLLEADGQIESINTQNVSLSEQLAADFSAYQGVLLEREAKLKDELDEKSWKALRTLDSRKDALSEDRRQYLIIQYLQEHLSDIAILRVLGAKAKPAAPRNASVTNTDVGGLVYEPIPDAQGEVAAGLGRIRHKTSVLQFSPIQHDANTVDALDRQPSHGDLHLPLHPTASGTGEGIRFSTAQKSLMVTLSAENKTATAGVSKKSKYRAVCGAYEFGEAVSFGVKIGGCKEGFFLGVAESKMPANRDSVWSHDTGFCGWASHSKAFDKAKGKHLGQPWQDGDFFIFTVDCSKLQMTALHLRSMCLQTLDLPRHRLCFRAELTDGSSVTLVDLHRPKQ